MHFVGLIWYHHTSLLLLKILKIEQPATYKYKYKKIQICTNTTNTSSSCEDEMTDTGEVRLPQSSSSLHNNFKSKILCLSLISFHNDFKSKKSKISFHNDFKSKILRLSKISFHNNFKSKTVLCLVPASRRVRESLQWPVRRLRSSTSRWSTCRLRTFVGWLDIWVGYMGWI